METRLEKRDFNDLSSSLFSLSSTAHLFATLVFSTSTSTHTRYIFNLYIYDGKFQNYASIIFISLLSLQYFIESGLKFFRFRVCVCVCYVVVLFIIIIF